MGIRIISDADGYSNLQFGDVDDSVRGGISYNSADDSLQLRGYNNTTRATIDSSGNLLVGKTANDNTTVGASIRAGESTFTANNSRALTVGRNTNDGDLIQFRKATATVGSIGTQSGTDFYITGSTAVATGLRFQTNEIVAVNGSAGNRDGAIDIGKSNIRFKDLYLSGGAYLGGTGSANHLDDYEEGTWTPAISGATHTVQQGFYTKVGDLVFFKLRIAWSAYNNAAGGVLTGLPFTADAAIESMGVSVYVNSGFGSIPSGKGYLNAYVAANNTTLHFTWQPNTAVAEFAGSGNIYVAGTYLT
jgi:hypothetical protein